MGEVILTMKDIDKSFPGVHALDHVNFEVKRGEVHALMGENGAGKSTLMKVLTGIYQKDSGSITYKGKETEFHNTREAQDAGVVIVHQELNMVGDLTVAQNIFIGREPKKGFSIDDKKMIEDSKKLFQELNIEINPKEKMNNLTVGKQQMCEIAKAISHKAEVIIFDEPSAALTEKEIADYSRLSVIFVRKAKKLPTIPESEVRDVSAIPATAVGRAKGSSIIPSISLLPGKSYFTSTHARTVPIIPFITAAAKAHTKLV